MSNHTNLSLKGYIILNTRPTPNRTTNIKSFHTESAYKKGENVTAYKHRIAFELAQKKSAKDAFRTQKIEQEKSGRISLKSAVISLNILAVIMAFIATNILVSNLSQYAFLALPSFWIFNILSILIVGSASRILTYAIDEKRYK